MKGKVYRKVYEIVGRIPKGKVLTYGLISGLLDGQLSAQGVGWALSALASKAKGVSGGGDLTVSLVPWHRVINARGRLSTYKNPNLPPDLQRVLLEAEGVVFDDTGQVSLSDYLWQEGLASMMAAAP